MTSEAVTAPNGATLVTRMSQQGAAAIIGQLRGEGLTVPATRSTLYDAPSFTIPLE